MDEIKIIGKRPTCVYCKTQQMKDIRYCPMCQAPQCLECWIDNINKCGNCGHIQVFLPIKKKKVAITPPPSPPNRTTFGENVVDKRNGFPDIYPDFADQLVDESEIFVPVITRLHEYICGFILMLSGLCHVMFFIISFCCDWGPWKIVNFAFFFSFMLVGYWLVKNSCKYELKSHKFIQILWFSIFILVGLFMLVLALTLSVLTANLGWLIFLIISVVLLGIGIKKIINQDIWSYSTDYLGEYY